IVFPRRLAQVLYCLFCLVFAKAGFGQSFSIGLKGGISIPNLTPGGTSNPLNSGYSSGLGPDAALFGEYHLSGLFSVEASVEYSAQGGKKNGKQALPVPSFVAAMYPPGQAPKYLYANFDASAEFDYLLIPVLAKFSFNLDERGTWRFYADAGPFVGFLLSAKTITKGTSNVYGDEAETQPLLYAPISFDTTTNIKDQIYNTNYGVAGNVGIAYHTGPHCIFFEGGGNYGFKILQKDKENGQNHAGAAVVRLGYAFTFGKQRPGAGAVREPNRF
ncbi:MAG TPA: porin family protein, partial [Puia sp.]|nr:porin family protein [Puia sp.]